jgi:hypothetical protein
MWLPVITPTSDNSGLGKLATSPKRKLISTVKLVKSAGPTVAAKYPIHSNVLNFGGVLRFSRRLPISYPTA